MDANVTTGASTGFSSSRGRESQEGCLEEVPQEFRLERTGVCQVSTGGVVKGILGTRKGERQEPRCHVVRVLQVAKLHAAWGRLGLGTGLRPDPEQDIQGA